MIPEHEIVTKTFLAKELETLRTEIRTEMKEQKYDILREVRSMMHETLEGAMENMKAYYKVETERYMGVLQQGFKDEMLYYKDEVKVLVEKMNNHETRIGVLERDI
jgi:hypothetical protein